MFFDTPPAPDTYTLSLHDALPIYSLWRQADYQLNENPRDAAPCNGSGRRQYQALGRSRCRVRRRADSRSEEHTSELQSHVKIVCRLLLEKEKASGRTARWPSCGRP